MHDRKAGIGDRGSRFDRFRVTIKRNEARIRGDAGKNGTAVPAAAESGVDENTVACAADFVGRFRQKNRAVKCLDRKSVV